MVMKQQGFTLLEMLVVVAIIGILAAIAYPSYENYVRKARRGDMQSELMRMAQEAQRYQVINRSFNGMNMGHLNSTGSFPSGTAYYNIALTPAPTNTTWTMVATPTGAQAGDGVICLNSAGHKFWARGANACALTPTSTWRD